MYILNSTRNNSGMIAPSRLRIKWRVVFALGVSLIYFELVSKFFVVTSPRSRSEETIGRRLSYRIRI